MAEAARDLARRLLLKSSFQSAWDAFTHRRAISRSGQSVEGLGQALALDADGNLLVVAHVDIWNSSWNLGSTELLADFYVARVSTDADTMLPQRDPVPPRDTGADPEPEPTPPSARRRCRTRQPKSRAKGRRKRVLPRAASAAALRMTPLFGGRDRSLFVDFARVDDGDAFNLIGDEEADEELLLEILSPRRNLRPFAASVSARRPPTSAGAPSKGRRLMLFELSRRATGGRTKQKERPKQSAALWKADLTSQRFAFGPGVPLQRFADESGSDVRRRYRPRAVVAPVRFRRRGGRA
jgi:hypothetical protein